MCLVTFQSEEQNAVYAGFSNLSNVRCCSLCILFCLFVLICAQPIFTDKITLHIFVGFCTSSIIVLFFILCLIFFWSHQISSMRLDSRICVHRHVLFIYNFSPAYFVFVFPSVLILFPTVVF